MDQQNRRAPGYYNGRVVSAARLRYANERGRGARYAGAINQDAVRNNQNVANVPTAQDTSAPSETFQAIRNAAMSGACPNGTWRYLPDNIGDRSIQNFHIARARAEIEEMRAQDEAARARNLAAQRAEQIARVEAAAQNPPGHQQWTEEDAIWHTNWIRENPNMAPPMATFRDPRTGQPGYLRQRGTVAPRMPNRDFIWNAYYRGDDQVQFYAEDFDHSNPTGTFQAVQNAAISGNWQNVPERIIEARGGQVVNPTGTYQAIRNAATSGSWPNGDWQNLPARISEARGGQRGVQGPIYSSGCYAPPA